jgi:hypothetical protein
VTKTRTRQYYKDITIVNDNSRVTRMTPKAVASPTIVILTTLEVSFMLVAWTNFSKQDRNWAEFSTLEVTACLVCTCSAMKQNSLT